MQESGAPPGTRTARDAQFAVDAFNDIPLRRALFRGYRVGDVQLVVAYFRSGMQRLESEVAQAGARAATLEVELRVLRTRLEDYVRRETEVKQALADVEARALDIEEDAKARARQVVRDAEEHAARLRTEVLARLTATGRQFEELLAARNAFVEVLRSALGELEPVLGRLDVAAPAAPTERVPEPEQPETGAGDDVAFTDELRRRAAGEDDRERVYDGRVELDAGPFADFAELSSFARAIRRVPGISDVDVGAFADERATLGLTLTGPVTLGRALAETVSAAFEIDSADERSLSITFAADTPSSAQ